MNRLPLLDNVPGDAIIRDVATKTSTRTSTAGTKPGQAPAPGIATLDQTEVDALIERAEEALEHDLELAATDLRLLLGALKTLAGVSERLEHDDLTIRKLRKLLGIERASEKLKDLAGSAAQGNTGTGGSQGAGDAADNADATGTGTGDDAAKDRRKSPARKKTPTAPLKPAVVHHPIGGGIERGQLCPGCAHGKLYKYQPSEFTRIVGHPPYSAERHVSEQLRCNGCGEIHRAELPAKVRADGAPGQQFGYSARAVMAIAKFFDADPYFRQQTVQGLFGVSLSASTIFDQCEHLANALNPVYRAIIRAAAGIELFHIDDTTHRILDAVPIEKRRGERVRMRSGVYSSVLTGTVPAAAAGAGVDTEAVVAVPTHRIVLYQTNIGHAGEWLEQVLGYRAAGLDPPVVMSDALSSNRVHGHEVKVAGCHAHARRKFVEVLEHYPNARFALDTYAILWKNEGDAFEQGLDAGQRLDYHREHSAPAFDTLVSWCDTELESGRAEPNGPLGQAMRYVLNHREALTLFLREPDVPLDNNLAERLLKLIVRGRRNSGFYKTQVGAQIGDVISSVLAICHENGINAFDYLCAVQRHAERVRGEPDRWLPWNYATAAKAAEA